MRRRNQQHGSGFALDRFGVLALLASVLLLPALGQAQTPSERREKRGQIALAQEGRNQGALAYLSFEDAFQSGYGNIYVRRQLAEWIQQGKRIRQIATVPGQHGVVVITDRNDAYVHPQRGGLQQIARELSLIRQADLPIDLVALPPSAATEGHFLAVLGREVTHRGVASAAAAVESLLAQGRAIDVVAFPPTGGWIVVSGDRIRSGGLPADAHVLSVLRNHLNRGRRIDDVAFDPGTFGKAGERGGFVVLDNGRIFALDVPCNSLENVNRWAYEKGGRSVLCNTSTVASTQEPERKVTGVVDLNILEVVHPEENAGDEPFLLVYPFRGRLGPDAITVRHREGVRIPRMPIGKIRGTGGNNWAREGDRFELPDESGRNEFEDLREFEAFGTFVVLVEADGTTPRRRARAIACFENILRNKLRSALGGQSPDFSSTSADNVLFIAEQTRTRIRRARNEARDAMDECSWGTDDVFHPEALFWINLPEGWTQRAASGLNMEFPDQEVTLCYNPPKVLGLPIPCEVQYKLQGRISVVR